MQAVEAKEGGLRDPMVSARVARMRVAAGLLQALCLCFLYARASGARGQPWPADQLYWYASLFLLAMLAPVLFISSLGHMKAGRAAVWLGSAMLIMAGLACHDIWRDGAVGKLWLPGEHSGAGSYPSGALMFFAGAGFFIAHTLVQAANQDGRRIASYHTYFEAAWKLALQLIFSLFFVGVLWLILIMGSILFGMVGLRFFGELLQLYWVAIPICCCAFSCAMHVTDVRPAIVRGIRTLLLVLMSWILPLATLLVAVFLLSMAFGGPAGLSVTRAGAAMTASAGAVLVFFINAAFQDGEAGAGAARVVRLSARLAALLLTPLTAIVVYALSLRVAHYGWTNSRIIAACCLLVAACYAGGYGWAACRRGPWLAAVARVNVLTSFLILALLLAVFTPVGDPARLSVNSQMARFAAGKSTMEDLDVKYLRDEGARYGLAALLQLQAGALGPDAALLRNRTAHELAKKQHGEAAPDVDETDVEEQPADLAVNLEVLPAGAQLPPSFLRERWPAPGLGQANWPECLTMRGVSCQAFVLAPDRDGRAQVMLVGEPKDIFDGVVLMAETADGHWRRVGEFPDALAACAAFKRQLAAGTFSWVAPQQSDMLINGERVRIKPSAAPPRSLTLCEAPK